MAEYHKMMQPAGNLRYARKARPQSFSGHPRKSLELIKNKLKPMSPRGLDHLNIFNMKAEEIVDEIKRILKKKVRKVGDFKLK